MVLVPEGCFEAMNMKAEVMLAHSDLVDEWYDERNERNGSREELVKLTEFVMIGYSVRLCVLC